jgi:hypothetical protein
MDDNSPTTIQDKDHPFINEFEPDYLEPEEKIDDSTDDDLDCKSNDSEYEENEDPQVEYFSPDYSCVDLDDLGDGDRELEHYGYSGGDHD